MNIDIEMLKLAAKAICYTLVFNKADAPQLWKDGEYVCFWNPLTDDGDALRLAVKLRIPVETDICFAEVPYEKQCEVTRCAIVRAAAEIGRQMQEGGTT